MSTNNEPALLTERPDPRWGTVTLTVTLTPMLHAFYLMHAQDSGKTLSQAVQLGVDCYADAMASQRRADDALWDQLGVPPEHRTY